MKLPKRIPLYYEPSKTYFESHVTELTEALIKTRVAEAWWNDPALDVDLASAEIDRNWDWTELEIEHGGRILKSRKLGVITGDGAVQGAMMISDETVKCDGEMGKTALYIELLFAAPGNRKWIRLDGAEQYKGVGMALLGVAAELSLEAGCGGRLKLEASPGSITWYKNRGLLEVSAHRILHKGVEYTPMELGTDRVSMLLPS